MVRKTLLLAFLGLFSIAIAYASFFAIRYAFINQFWLAGVVVFACFAALFLFAPRFSQHGTVLESAAKDTQEAATNEARTTLLKHICNASGKTWSSIFLLTFMVNMPAMLFVGHFFLGGSGADYKDLFEIATAYLDGQDNPHWWEYGSYPNNHFLLMFMICFFKLIYAVVPDASNNLLLWCHIVVNVAFIQASFFILAHAVALLWGKRRGALCGLATIMCAPYWANSSNPYSDTGALLFVCISIWMAAYFYSAPQEKKWQKLLACVGLGLACGIGFKIKATVAIIAVAFVLLVLFAVKAKKALAASVCVALALVLGMGACNAFVEAVRPAELSYTAADRNERSFPYIHWVMMGINPWTEGLFNWEDYWYTANQPGCEEKITVDKQRIQERLDYLGPAGVVRHVLVTKTMRQWSSGALFNDSVFWRESALQDAEGGDWQTQRGTFYTAFFTYSSYAQGYYICLLLCTVACAILYLREGTYRALLQQGPYMNAESIDHGQATMLVFLMVAIFGFGLFLCLIWEVKPRYLLHFLPLFTILAADGAARLRYLRTIKNAA